MGKTSATFENAQNAVRNYRRLKLKCKPRWNAMYDVLDSHVKAEQEIRECAKKFPERVGDDTVTRSFLKKAEKHTPYRKEMKECHADLQGKGPLLHEGQDALDILAECVLAGEGAFEHCKLKDTAFKK